MTGMFANYTLSNVCPSAGDFVDYSVFAHPDFDPNDYANAVLAGETYPVQPGKSRPTKNTSFSPANEDISVAISKLNFSIDDVDKQLKNVVNYILRSPSFLGFFTVVAGYHSSRGTPCSGRRRHRARRLSGGRTRRPV